MKLPWRWGPLLLVIPPEVVAMMQAKERRKRCPSLMVSKNVFVVLFFWMLPWRLTTWNVVDLFETLLLTKIGQNRFFSPFNSEPICKFSNLKTSFIPAIPVFPNVAMREFLCIIKIILWQTGFRSNAFLKFHLFVVVLISPSPINIFFHFFIIITNESSSGLFIYGMCLEYHKELIYGVTQEVIYCICGTLSILMAYIERKPNKNYITYIICLYYFPYIGKKVWNPKK